MEATINTSDRKSLLLPLDTVRSVELKVGEHTYTLRERNGGLHISLDGPQVTSLHFIPESANTAIVKAYR